MHIIPDLTFLELSHSPVGLISADWAAPSMRILSRETGRKDGAPRRHQPSRHAWRRFGSVACVVLLVVYFLTRTATALAAGESQQVRVRIEWGGGNPRLWHGLLEVDEGRFEQPASLGVEADEPGTIWVDGTAVWIQRRSVRLYDGLDVTVCAPGQARLNMTLSSPAQGSSPMQTAFGLAELGDGPIVAPLGTNGARVVIRRSPGDALAVDVDREHLIYNPGESFVASVLLKPLTPPSANSTASLVWKLTKARSNLVIDRGTRRVQPSSRTSTREVIPLEIKLPSEEGVYDIRLQLSGTEIGLLRSAVQVVVLETGSGPRQVRGDSGIGKLVDGFRPHQATFLRRIEPDRGIRLMNHSWKSWFELFPNQVETESSAEHSTQLNWSAYRLRVRRPGRPHRLVVSVPSAVRQSLGVSILQPNAAGQLMPVGLDTGLHVLRVGGDEAFGTTSDSATSIDHEVIFWPRVTDPILVLYSLAAGSSTDVSSIEMYELESLAPVSQKQPRQSGLKRRLVGPFMQKPLLPENFGAAEAFDEQSQRSLDDYVTFYTAARRVAWYLHYAGYNCLMIAALADGSTIYPSRQLQPTPRYDTGTYFSTGQDVIRKDVLELLYRVFDREGLVLIPQLQFSTPLPELERILAAGGEDARGIELIGRDGRSWRESRGTIRGLAPYYNPLDTKVQQAIIAVVDELAQRYRHHASYNGIAVELSSDGYLQLPGLKWGYDDATVARFEREREIQLPDGSGEGRHRRRYEFLTGEKRLEWVDWRCEQLALFHRRLAQTVTAKHPTARFILAGNRTLRGSNPDENVYDTLKAGGRLDELLAPKGLEFSRYPDGERMVVLRPSVWEPHAQRLRRVLDETINDHPQLVAAFSEPESGRLFYHAAQDRRIAEFDVVSPWQPAYTWLVPSPTPAGAANRKRYAHCLADDDALLVFDGGWTIPLGQEKYTREVRAAIQALPAVGFHSVVFQTDPLVVRTALHDGRTYIYVVNEFEGRATASLRLSCAPHTEGRVLGCGESLTVRADGKGGARIPIELRSYDVWACELYDADVRIEGVDIELVPKSIEALKNRIRRLDAMLSETRHADTREETVLRNPGFESMPQRKGGLPGWTPPVENATHWALDNKNPRSGRSSLMLVAEKDAVAGVNSHIRLDENNHAVRMSVWLRSDGESTPVRLAFVGDVDDASRAQVADVVVDNRWRRYVFRVNDVPSGRLKDATLRIEVRGPGRVWVDDVQVDLRRLTDDRLRQLIKLYSAANLAFDERRYSDCQRLLDGYWGQYLFEEQGLDMRADWPPSEASGLIDGLQPR